MTRLHLPRFSRLSLTAFATSVLLAFGVPLSASATPVVVATIPTTTYPMSVAMSPDGTKVYSANYLGEIKTVDTGTNQVLSSGTIPGFTSLATIAVNPVSGLLYGIQNGFPSSVLVVDMSGTAPSVLATISVGANAKSLAVSPDGTRVYVGNNGSTDNSISVIDTSTNTVVATIAPPNAPTTSGAQLDAPRGIVVSADSQTVYVSYYDDDNGATSVPGLAKINASNNTVTTVVEFPFTAPNDVHPIGLALSSDSTKLYMANFGNSSPGKQWIETFNLVAGPQFTSSTQTPTTTLYPRELALSADNSTLFVSFDVGSNPAGTFQVYPTSTMSSPTVLNLTGAGRSTYIAPAVALGSHFAYVATNTNLFLVGEYLSQYRQVISGTTGAIISSSALTASGFSGTPTYSISPGLPSGFTFNSATGVVSGSSSTPVAQSTFTITGTDGSNTAIATVLLTVTTPGSTPTATATATASAAASSNLAATGADAGLPFAVFGAMCMLGALAVLAARRRTH